MLDRLTSLSPDTANEAPVISKFRLYVDRWEGGHQITRELVEKAINELKPPRDLSIHDLDDYSVHALDPVLSYREPRTLPQDSQERPETKKRKRTYVSGQTEIMRFLGGQAMRR